VSRPFDEESQVKLEQAPALSHVIELEVSERTREIFIGDEIDEDFASWFPKVMRRLESISHEPITIWLNTPGGDLDSMFVFHDLVTKSPCAITIVGIGTVCSAGCLMLACGGTHGGKRLVTESCTFMWHESRDAGVADLTESEKIARREYDDWQSNYWRDLMARHVKGKSTKFWFNITNKTREHWLLGGQAIIDAGIADALYSYDLLPGPAKKLAPVPEKQNVKSGATT
jgi:ATP-dependent protease ClpP protease subunit